MRLYEKRALESAPVPSIAEPCHNLKPGFTIPEVVRMFYAEGVVPDFIPADLGRDESDEVDADSGLWAVDAAGNIRTDPMDYREASLMAGLPAPDAPATGDLAPNRSNLESGTDSGSESSTTE